MSTLGGVPMQSHSLHYPSGGSWRVDAVLTEGKPPNGAVDYVVGGLTLKGKIKHSGLDAADRPHAVVVGGLGWHSSVTRPLSLQSDSGVRLSSVLKLLAAAASEPYEAPPDVTIGDYYELVASRPGEPVSYADALGDLARSGLCPVWRVDPDGVTRFGARAAVAVTARATVIRQDTGLGVVTYGLDDPAQFLPGNTIDGAPIQRLDLSESRGKLTADVYAKDGVPSLRELVRQMVASEISDRVRTYIVAAASSDGRCDLVPPDDAPHLPEMKNVQQWCLGAGMVRAKAGDQVVVIFRDARKSRPVIVGFELGAGPFADAATVGTTVSVVFPPLCPVTGLINGSTPFAGMLTIVDNGIGQIDFGSTRLGVEQ